MLPLPGFLYAAHAAAISMLNARHGRQMVGRRPRRVTFPFRFLSSGHENGPEISTRPSDISETRTAREFN